MIIQNKNYYGFDIEKIEKRYKAKYLGDFSVKNKDGDWTDSPVSVFYQSNPDKSKGHTNYFGLRGIYVLVNDNPVLDGIYISNAESAFSQPLTAIKTDEGDYLISGYRHDFNKKDEYMIDGGRAYIRCNMKGKLVKLIVSHDEFIEVSPELIDERLKIMEEEY